MKNERDGNEIINTAFSEKYQNKLGWFHNASNSNVLHDNSKELLEIINKYEIIDNNKDYKLLEIGAAGCRNLKYIYDKYPQIQYFANDLHKEASFKNMHPSIKKVINFYEGKTQDIIKKFTPNSVDLLIDSDHLVHVNYTDTIEIVNYINKTIKPKYFLIRSVTIDNPKRKTQPYHKHDFNKLLTNYEEIFYKISDNDKSWYIKLFKLKI